MLTETFAPPCDARLHVYAVLSPEDARALLALRPGAPVLLTAVHGIDWNRQLSPWPAARCFRGGEDFAGGADALLSDLLAALDPLDALPRALLGYSLAGLFALYALYRTDAFGLVASVSGSLWYDGFTDFMRASPLRARGAKVYLSLGDRESGARSARLARVGEETEKACALLTGAGAEAFFEQTPGNHFANPPGRMARALDYLISRA